MGTIKLYLSELISLSSALLKSTSWPTKIQAALTIADVAKSIGYCSSSIISFP
jgi:hypothetical protein